MKKYKNQIYNYKRLYICVFIENLSTKKQCLDKLPYLLYNYISKINGGNYGNY